MMIPLNRMAGLLGVLALLLLGSATVMAQENSTHTVVAYDSLDQIGAFYDVQPACLAEKNNLSHPGKLRVGDKIVIDYSCPPYDGVDIVVNPRTSAANDSAATSGQGGGGGNGYTVQRGDTLDGIAAQFDVQVTCLADQNSIERINRVFPGQNLAIPANCPPYDGYDTVTNPRGG